MISDWLLSTVTLAVMGRNDNFPRGHSTSSRSVRAAPAQVTARGGCAPLLELKKMGQVGTGKNTADPCPEINGDLRHAKIRVTESGARFSQQFLYKAFMKI